MEANTKDDEDVMISFWLELRGVFIASFRDGVIQNFRHGLGPKRATGQLQDSFFLCLKERVWQIDLLQPIPVSPVIEQSSSLQYRE